jgi:thiamine kinase-like enzyme
MEIEVKGHSGCKIDVANEGNHIFVYKSTSDSKYFKRLVLQAEKQKAAANIEYQHIRIPKILDIEKSNDLVIIKMQYVYSKNFIEFFEQAGFEQIDYLIGALEYFIEHEINRCSLETISAGIFQDKFAEIKSKCGLNPCYREDLTIHEILSKSERFFSSLPDIQIPVGVCHGDLTFSNILFNGNNYYLIDFLDSFIETPLQDIVKIRQDTAFHWSQLMYNKRFDEIRLKIIFQKIDREIDQYFCGKYQWYRDYYQIFQLMNILRILPYAHEDKVISHLKDVLNSILYEK